MLEDLKPVALDILIQGAPFLGQITDEEYKKVVYVLSMLAKDEPSLLFQAIKDVFQVRIDGMLSLALAILTAQAPEFFFRKKEIDEIQLILGELGPKELLEYVEYLKSKIFGKGFGSRPQKWIRKIMENWAPKEIISYNQNYPKQFSALVKLCHPRYRDSIIATH